MSGWLAMFVLVASVGDGDATDRVALDRARADRVRIQSHLARVEATLRARDVSDLSPQLRTARTENLDRLRAYWQAGRFPQNHDRIGERVPIFVDPEGTACAVGHLVIESGAMQVAQEIRAHENTAYLDEMRHPALDGWIAESGLTKSECAQIQPTYCGCDQELMPVCGVDGKTYANACYAETCAMVDIAHEGECKADGTTGWPPAGTGPDDTDATDASTGATEDTSVDDAGTTEPDRPSTTSTSTPDTSTGAESSGAPDVEDDAVKGRGCRVGGRSALALVVMLLGIRRKRR